MPRIRTIKPEMPEDEKLGRCSRDARLMFVYLITQSDCHGNQRATLPLLRGKLFPYDDDINLAGVRCWLDELERAGLVSLYEVDGQSYLHICNWTKHQKVHKPAPSTIPQPPGTDEPQSGRDSSADESETGRGPSALDLDRDHDLDLDLLTTARVGVNGPVDNYGGEEEWT